MTFPQLSHKGSVVNGTSFMVPDGSNGADPANEATLGAYDNSTDVPWSVIGPNNVCLVKLEKAFTNTQLDGSKKQF